MGYIAYTGNLMETKILQNGGTTKPDCLSSHVKKKQTSPHNCLHYSTSMCYHGNIFKCIKW